MIDFSVRIQSWYDEIRRDLPWRDTRDPYFIWLSEVILQQTRVDQGLKYYLAFVTNYNTIDKLAEANEEEVLKLWQGLGYYSRARNLHTTAKYISTELNGVFPSNYEDILKLKGVGEYTAAAIASFCFEIPKAVVDGNVFRVLSRVFGICDPIDTTQGKKKFNELAQELLDKKKPSNHNQAIMEFGAMVCTPKNPKCDSCVLSTNCATLEGEEFMNYPVKIKKIKQRTRYFHYFIINNDEYIYLNQRDESDIWEKMYDFPSLELDKEMAIEDVLNSSILKKHITNNRFRVDKVSGLVKHVLSHQIIFASFYELTINQPIGKTKFLKIKREDINDYPLPKLIDNYINAKNSVT